MPAFIAFLNTTKYPASLSFLLMTLGPAILMLGLIEHRESGVMRWLATFGRVPFFYYLLHIPLIHLLALGVSQLRSGSVHPWLFDNHPMNPGPVPEGYRWSLHLLYAVWVIAVVLLYLPSRWFADLKARRRDAWLKYL